MSQDIDKLKDIVIQLHDAARLVTQELGLSTLTLDIRECADRLNDLLTIKD